MEEPKIHLRRDKQIRAHDKRRHAPPFWQADRPYLHEHHISDARFRRLGYIMAMLAGAINAGGFFAFARYTSHVTGSMSLLADAVYLREWITAAVALISVLCFVVGAAHSGWVVLWTQQKRFRGSFGFSMWLEAVLSADIRLVRTDDIAVEHWKREYGFPVFGFVFIVFHHGNAQYGDDAFIRRRHPFDAHDRHGDRLGHRAFARAVLFEKTSSAPAACACQ